MFVTRKMHQFTALLGIVTLGLPSIGFGATFQTFLSQDETNQLKADVSNCKDAACYKAVSDDYFDRSQKNLGIAIQSVPKQVVNDLNLKQCYTKGVFATKLIACERNIFNTAFNQIDAIDTDGSMATAPMPGAVRTLIGESCAGKSANLEEAIKTPSVDKCAKDLVQSLQKRMKDAREIMNAADLNNRRASVVSQMCKKSAAVAKHLKFKCTSETSQADLLAKAASDAIKGPSIPLSATIDIGAAGLKGTGSQAGGSSDGSSKSKGGSNDGLYNQGRFNAGNSGIQCPSFIPHVFCGNGKYDPRKYQQQNRAAGAEGSPQGYFVYNEKTAVPDDNTSIRELMSGVYDGAIQNILEEDLAEHYASKAIENALQNAALNLDADDFKAEVDELANSASCLPSHTGANKVRSLAALVPQPKNSDEYLEMLKDPSKMPPDMAARLNYHADMAIAAQCAKAVQNRTTSLRKIIGMDAKPVGPWVDPAALKETLGDTGGSVAEFALGFNPLVAKVVFAEVLDVDKLTAPKCHMLNERQSLEVRNYCRGVKGEFTLLSNEMNMLLNQYPQLSENHGEGLGMDAIVKAGGLDPRIAGYDLDTNRARGNNESLTDESGEMQFCMERAKAAKIVPNKAAMDAVAHLVKVETKKELESFHNAIKTACKNPSAVAADAILDGGTMEEFYNCSRPRFGLLARYLDINGETLKKMSDTLSANDCRDRMNSSVAACYFYKNVQTSKDLKAQASQLAVHSAQLGMDAMALTGFGAGAKLFAGGLKGGFRKVLARMAAGAVGGAKGGVAFGLVGLGVEKGTQYLTGGTEGQLKATQEAEQFKFRSGTGTYEGLASVQSALKDAAKSDSVARKILTSALYGALFGVLESHPGNDAHGKLSAKDSEIVAEKMPELNDQLEKAGSFKGKEGAKLEAAVNKQLSSVLGMLEPEETGNLTKMDRSTKVGKIKQWFEGRKAKRELLARDPEFFSDPELLKNEGDLAAVHKLVESEPVEAVKLMTVLESLDQDTNAAPETRRAKFRNLIRKLIKSCPKDKAALMSTLSECKYVLAASLLK